MSFLQKSVIKKYLSNIPQEEIASSYRTFKEKYSPSKIHEIRQIKEEEYQDGFLRDIFVGVLGYTLKPDDGYDLSREFKNQSDSKKADGAILKGGKAIAVIELKSNKTKSLKSITEQAFNYKNNQPLCKYVITSNFRKIRFYIDYAGEYEEFNLFNLEIEDFQLLYLILSKDSIFADIPMKLKKESIFHEESVSNRLYKEYSTFKNNLFENLIKNNPENDKLTLFKKSQKLIDRFLFIFFAEDRGLLPPNSIDRIIERFNILKDEDAYKPLYDIYKQYFGYMNTGRNGKTPNDDIPAYNGGLFSPDVVLDNLIIDDGVLVKDLRKFSAYDFNTEVDVNVLGHIFEHSLSEIEEITAKIEGNTINKNKSKRKKDGVFYTPKYITQYIVENTVGTLCEEKRKALDITEIEIDESHHNKDGKLSAKGKDLQGKLENYKKWLLSLKIVDPACGSGAFLNQALNFLINEHKLITEIQTDLQKGQIPLFNIETHILENNLYGVDLNEESIEIAKLSLWLRTAKKGRKLSSLNDNIKCGNSLIDDSKIAGEKAFNWNKEFPEVFEKGRFDIVIGNPPYGVIDLKENNAFYKHKFESFQGNLENYCFFTEMFIKLGKGDTGRIGLIIPMTWLSIQQFENLRKVVLQNNLHSIVALPTKVFSDANLDTLICIINKGEKHQLNKVEVIKVQGTDSAAFGNSISNPILIEQRIWDSKSDLRIDIDYNPEIDALISKIKSNCCSLKDYFRVSQGIIPYAREELYKTLSKKDADSIVDKRLWHSDKKQNEFFKHELKGEDVSRYRVEWNGVQWVKYGEWLARPRTPEFFNSERVLIREITRGKRLNAGYTEDESYNNPGIINIISVNKNDKIKMLKSLLSILNSRFIYFFHLNTSSKARLKTSIPKILIRDVEHLPIPQKGLIMASELEQYSDKMSRLVSSLHHKTKTLLKYIEGQYAGIDFSKKLNSWPEIDWSQFIKELNRAIKKVGAKKLSKVEEMKWLEVFETKKAEVQKIQTEIDETDNEIDHMVYKLYDLTDEEIKIVNGEV